MTDLDKHEIRRSQRIMSGMMTPSSTMDGQGQPQVLQTPQQVHQEQQTSPHHLSVIRDRELSENSFSSIQLISDIGAYTNIEEASFESISTSAILRYCKLKVLRPYFRLLSVLGWRPLISQATLFENALWARLLNFLYSAFIIALILTGYLLQYSSCYRQDGYRPYADPVPNAQKPNGGKLLTFMGVNGNSTNNNHIHNSKIPLPSSLDASSRVGHSIGLFDVS